MRIPPLVKIGAITYRVEIADTWPGRCDGDDGECCYRKETGNVLYIFAGLSREAQELTFVHEALHAMNTTMDHEFLDSLAQQLYAFGHDNDLWKNGAR